MNIKSTLAITPIKFTSRLATALVIVAGFWIPAHSSSPDWSKIDVQNVKLFYPGESTYQWLRSSEHKRADRKTLQGDSCTSCHEGEEEEMGNAIVSGEKIEPMPMPDKNGVIDLAIQAAHDSDYLYWRFQWESNMNREGRMHDMMRFDGEKWKFYGSHRAKEAVMEGNSPPIYEDRFSIMVDDGSVPMFAEQGCWLTCHDSMRHMPERPEAEDVKAHAYLGKMLKKSDIRKYLPSTRTDEDASWDAVKSADEIATLKAAGQFVDLMQWRVHRSNPVEMADDGYVLEYRLFDEGKKMFSWNVDKKTMTPKYMFDKGKVGYIAMREEWFDDQNKVTAIVKERNAKPFDANAGFKEGDILPGRLLTAQTTGSAGDNNSSSGTWEDGTYTLVFRRKLDTGHPEDDKIMKVGGVYTVGFGVHDDNVTTRFHHVSFPLTVGIGTEADITAVTIK